MFLARILPAAAASLASSRVLADARSYINSGVNASGLSGGPTVPGALKNIINLIIYFVGAIAILMVVIGALRMVTSAGNSSQVKGARETILYALIGVAIAILAYAIVNFVILKIG